MKLAFSFFLLILFLNACSNNKNDEYVLPDYVELNSYTFFDPIFVEYLTETPLKYGVIWNDSLLKHGKIFKIQIFNKGTLSPNSITEKSTFLFDRKGKFKEFNYYNFKFSDSVYTLVYGEHAKGNLNSLKTSLFFGQKQHSEIRVIYLKEEVQYVCVNKNALNDTTFIYLKNNRPIVIVDKLGNYISKMQFIGEYNNSLSSLKLWQKKMNISDENWRNTEKIIIETEDFLPHKAFKIDQNLMKTELSAEWIYENDKKLSSFKKYLNGNCTHNFTFEYSEDKVMRSFRLNRKLYEIYYN